MHLQRNALALLFALSLSASGSRAQSAVDTSSAAKVIIDTDIGDDIDDAFAVDLALVSPELHLLGISAAWGNTALRARMLDRMMCEVGRTDIPIQVGRPSQPDTKPTARAAAAFSQRPWAEAGVERPHGDAVDFLLQQANRYPGQVTLLALAPLTNIGAAIDRDPAAFRKLKRVVLMGGSVYRGYNDNLGYGPPHAPQAEYNIEMDPTAAQKLFRSGVPIFMMPLDSTQLKFDETKRALFASISTPMTDTLQVLIAEWSHSTHNITPTMFDAVAAAYAIDSNVCPTTPLHIEVDDKGFTRAMPGAPNAQVCLEPKGDAFFQLMIPRLLQQQLVGTAGQGCIAQKKR